VGKSRLCGFPLITFNMVLPVLPDKRPEQLEAEVPDYAVKDNHQEDFEFPMCGIVQERPESFGRQGDLLQIKMGLTAAVQGGQYAPRVHVQQI
jgi:hypothetical protein